MECSFIALHTLWHGGGEGKPFWVVRTGSAAERGWAPPEMAGSPFSLILGKLRPFHTPELEGSCPFVFFR